MLIKRLNLLQMRICQNIFQKFLKRSHNIAGNVVPIPFCPGIRDFCWEYWGNFVLCGNCSRRLWSISVQHLTELKFPTFFVFPRDFRLSHEYRLPQASLRWSEWLTIFRDRNFLSNFRNYNSFVNRSCNKKISCFNVCMLRKKAR